MEIQEFRRHPLFCLAKGSRVFRNCWNFRLRLGENTRHRLQSRAEEIYLILDGIGRMTVGGKSSAVRPGEMIFVPPQVDHHLENHACPLLQGISVQAEQGVLPAEPTAEAGVASGRESPLRMDEILANLPWDVDSSAAIRTIVQLFDVCGALSEQIDQALGLDNELGQGALTQLEEKLMQSVGAVVDRFRKSSANGDDWFPSRWSR